MNFCPTQFFREWKNPLKGLLLEVDLVSNEVVSNRGAATHKGAVKRCQGCHQILNFLPI
jgi:hypothetical protein